MQLYDYPRDRYSRDRKDSQEVTILVFELTPEGADELVATLSQPPAKKPKTITYTTYYSGEDGVRTEVQFNSDLETSASGAAAGAIIETVATAIDATQADDCGPVQNASTTALGQIDGEAPVWEPATVAAVEAFSASGEWYFRNASGMRNAVT